MWKFGGVRMSENSAKLSRLQEDVDGFLVGGASLKGPDFITIANAFEMSTV